MNKDRIEYVLNAIFYCIWLRQVKFGLMCKRLFQCILSVTTKLFLTNERRDRFYFGYNKRQIELSKYQFNKEYGLAINLAKDSFGLYTYFPFSIFSFASMGAFVRMFYDINLIVFIVISAVPLIASDILVRKTVYKDKRYLKYFEKFEKEDEKWHKKWKRRTRIFTLASLLSLAISILSGFAILTFS